MTYVITQSCAADTSCVVACPVNCIHPAPGEPGFAEAEMLHIDANTCVGCGACVTACPAGAIEVATTVSPAQARFQELSAAYYESFPHAGRSPVALIAPDRPLLQGAPARVAIVGAGPAGLYMADELLRRREVSDVDVFDRMRTPHGLLRFGVSPDHGRTKNFARLFESIERERGFRYLLGVEVGKVVSLDELRSHYDAVVVAVGASADRRLGIPGENLVGSIAATHLVGWYNGHPEHQLLDVPLDHERAVVIGNGNVALDVARILTSDPELLTQTDLAPEPLEQMRRSRVREVVILGRRGPADASFTVPELIGLSELSGVDVIVDPSEIPPDAGNVKVRLLGELAARGADPSPTRPRIVLRFATTPIEILGSDRVTGVRVEAKDRTETIDAGLVVRAIGSEALTMPGLPVDPRTGTVPNEGGRVEPGLYVVGWIKRGATGLIGTNKTCAKQTADRLLEDFKTAVPRAASRGGEIAAFLQARVPDAFGLEGWHRLNAEEQARGRAAGRPRMKIVDPEEQAAVALS